MKKTYSWTTLPIGLAIALALYAAPAIAQQPPPQQAPLPFLVAIVDVAQLIKAHPEFEQKQQHLAAQVGQAEKQFQARQEEIAQQQRALNESTHLRSGSPEHQREIDAIAYKLADFEKDVKTHQRRFTLENSRIMYDTYKDIKETIGRYATANNIAQVTDYREFDPNPVDPQSVAEDMDQRLVWFNPRLNITRQIIQQLYAARGLPAPQAQTATAPAGGANPMYQR